MLPSGRHVFCEKWPVFKPSEVHELHAPAGERPKKTLQAGLQRRSSYFYQMVKSMVDEKILGHVYHMHARGTAT